MFLFLARFHLGGDSTHAQPTKFSCGFLRRPGCPNDRHYAAGHHDSATEYLCPAVAGVLIIPVVWEFGGKTGALLYLAVALLSLILSPNKEAALFFALLFGWYPLARPKLQHLRRKPLRVVLKLVLFNAALAVIIALLLFVLVSPDWQADAANWTGLVVAGMLVLGNVAFLIYDVLLARISDLYVYRLRPKLFPRHFS